MNRYNLEKSRGTNILKIETKSSFVQPDASTCVPTSLAYLLYKTRGVNFENTLDLLVKESYGRFEDMKKNGMDFYQIQEVAESLGIDTQLLEHKPHSKAYLTTITKFPAGDFNNNNLIEEAIKEDSLKIEKSFFVYPYGHAIAIFENKDKAEIFDSFFGSETTISLAELEKYIEQPASYLALS